MKAIVAEALEESSAEARAGLIKKRCGEDSELRREVESLLEQSTTAFEDFAKDRLQAFEREMSVLTPGLRVGAYQVIREIGRGGMGAVYLARRADGAFNKEVAIKVLKRGTDTDEVLGRFQGEREILARLVHPNIARLLDAGTTKDGLPYFVMDYVAGKPITTYATQRGLSIRERLGLFRVVCSAVSYAHQNLVIHRDLKPGNVLVTDEGEVKLLDFGIAKLLDDSNPEATLTIQRRLTPLYASPEQVRGEPVTTVSDVYSLGVFLYELLTGEPPYKLERHTSDEITKAICEQQPQKPSTTVGKADESSKLQAPSPHTGRTRPLASSKLLRGDVDNIVLKALRKEPSRRYSSVDQLSEDIRRHLEGLPVHARKDTAAYRVGKFIGRHKVGVAAATLTAAALIAASITTASQAREARREKRLAEQRFEQVRKLAHSVMFEYHDQIATLPGSTKLREQLVRDSLGYLNTLSQQAGNNITLLRELASAYEKVAAVQGGSAVSSRGNLLSMSNLGDTPGAIDSLTRAITIRERVSNLQPNDVDARRELAYSWLAIAAIYLTAGPPEKAAETGRQALSFLEPLVATDPSNETQRYDLLAAYLGLAKVLGNPAVPNLGDLQGALSYMAKAQAVGEKLAADHPDNLNYVLALGSLHNSFAWILDASGKSEEALKHAEEAIATDRKLVAADPNNTLYRRELAIQLGNASTFQMKLENRPAALQNAKEALAIYESLVTADPNDISIRRNLAVGYRNLAAAIGPTDPQLAMSNYQKALDVFAELVAKDPTNADFRRQWALVYLAVSRFRFDTKDFEAAATSAAEGIKIDERLVADTPKNASARNTLAQLYAQLGKIDVARASTDAKTKDEWIAAKEAYQKALTLYEEMKAKGTLSGADRDKPDELTVEIAKCEAALK